MPEESETNRESRIDRLKEIATVLAIPIAVLLVFAYGLYHNVSDSWSTQPDLDIVAHLTDVDGKPGFGTLEGRVLRDGDPVSGAHVWAIIHDGQGNRMSPPPGGTDKTNDTGQFTIPDIPYKLNAVSIVDVEIHCRLETKDKKVLHGVETLAAGGASRFRRIKLPIVHFLYLPALLLLSVLLPFLGHQPGRLRYVLAMVLAVTFSFCMIGSIAKGLYQVHSTGQEGETISLGFVSIFKGTYVPGSPPEWLVSLTAPFEQPAPARPQRLSSPESAAAVTPSGGASVNAAAPALVNSSGTENGSLGVQGPSSASPAPDAAPIQGFGAPLWVVLLAVIGASILTVSLIAGEIKDPPGVDTNKIRERIHNVVEHQIYILFAPIGGIFVYQTLVISDTARQPLTVAVAALGAGAAVNSLLKYAVDGASKLFTKTQ